MINYEIVMNHLLKKSNRCLSKCSYARLKTCSEMDVKMCVVSQQNVLGNLAYIKSNMD